MRIELLADPPEPLVSLRGNAGHCEDDGVPRAEGGMRGRSSQPDRGRYTAEPTEQHFEEAGSLRKGREQSLLSRLSAAGDDDRMRESRARDSRLGRALGKCRRGEHHGCDAHTCGESRDSDKSAQHERFLPLAAHFCYTAARCQVPARCQCVESAMASAAVLPRLPSIRSATCRVPQINVLPVVSRAEAMAGLPSRLMYISSYGPLIQSPFVPFTRTLLTLAK